MAGTEGFEPPIIVFHTIAFPFFSWICCLYLNWEQGQESHLRKQAYETHLNLILPVIKSMSSSFTPPLTGTLQDTSMNEYLGANGLFSPKYLLR